jgi:hypothetical protein
VQIGKCKVKIERAKPGIEQGGGEKAEFSDASRERRFGKGWLY